MPESKIKSLFEVHTAPKMQSMEMKAEMLITNIQCTRKGKYGTFSDSF